MDTAASPGPPGPPSGPEIPTPDDTCPDTDSRTDVPSGPSPTYSILPPGADPPATFPSTLSIASPSSTATTTAPALQARPSPALNPRSCVTCRRRKVRCDKQMPCSNCRRNHIHCVFPSPGRRPRRPRPRDPNVPPSSSSAGASASAKHDSELHERLKRLESMVEELSGQVVEPGNKAGSTSGSSPDAVHDGERVAGEGSATGAGANSGCGGSHEKPQGYEANVGVYKKIGRLVITNRKSRYISSAFWSGVKDELDAVRNDVHGLSDGTDYSSDEDDEHTPVDHPPPPDAYSHDAFIFGYRSASIDLAPYHPPPEQILHLWQLYRENVESSLKLIHGPTVDKMFHNFASGAVRLTAQNEALVFSIYYAAIVSLENDQTETYFSSPKAPLLSRHRFALEQALARTNLLQDLDFTVLTALVLFLTVVRRHDDSRFTWTATGLAIRIAQGLGLHRDGTHFGLPPFEVEMRRRVWWAICNLDLRGAEEAGTDLTIINRTFDTEFPTNINDADIEPSSVVPPRAREGLAEMAMALVRHEITALNRRLFALASAAGGVCAKDTSTSMAERESMLDEAHARVETNFLRHCAIATEPLFTLAGLVARIILSKASLVIYQPALFPGSTPDAEDLVPEVKTRLFVSAVEIVEYNYALNVDPRFRRWRWLFQTYTQWHAVAYILLEMCRRTPWTPVLERAWEALNMSLGDRHVLDLTKTADHLAVWMPLRKLFLKAKRHRDAQVARLRGMPEEVRVLEEEDRRNRVRSRFGSPPGMGPDLDGVRARWLALVQPVDEKEMEGVKPARTTQGITARGSQDASAGQSFVGIPPPTAPMDSPDMNFIDEIMKTPFDTLSFYRAMNSAHHQQHHPSPTTASQTTPPTPHHSAMRAAATVPTVPNPNPNPNPGQIFGSSAPVAGVDSGDPWLWASTFGTQVPIGQVPQDDDALMNLDTFDWNEWHANARALGRMPLSGNQHWGI